jgi:16S rRNA (guanine527-N7)-methyltransferase
MNREAAIFAATFDVSRETTDRLERYLALLERWNARINLVGPSTLLAAWTRHFADSTQLFALAPASARSWIDLGSGAGLPGLPIAAIAAEKRPALHMTLVEADRRKAAFLASAAREMALDVSIRPARIEALKPEPFDVVSARALAPLAKLCALAYPFTGRGTVLLFPKGARLDSELTAARPHWHIRGERIASRTQAGAAILRIVELEPRS